MKYVDYSVVIPVYKSTLSLIELAQRLKNVFTSMKASYEIIYVNDSPSFSPTNETLSKLTKTDPNIIFIQLSKNFGQQPATLCGVTHATGKWVITMDDDLQHFPEDIPSLVSKQASNCIVIAKLIDKQHSLFKRITSNIKGYFDYLLIGKPKNIKLSSFRLISREVVDNMLKIKTPFPFIPALLFQVSDNIENVEIKHHPRKDGVGNYTIRKMFSVFSNLIINNSSLLLKVVGYTGFLSFAISIFAGSIILFKKIIFGNIVAGWSSIMITVLFFGGINLFSIGVIGEYLIRIMATSEQKPTFFVHSITKGAK